MVVGLEPEERIMLEPFEGLGVEASWQFRMERAANLHIPYRSIADILMTIEYEAVFDARYREQVIQGLRPTISFSRPFSFRHHLADQWYDLHNPEQSSRPMTVSFETGPEDFAPNLTGSKVEHLTLYVSSRGGRSFEVPAVLRFAENGAGASIGGAVETVDGMIDTRHSNGAGWAGMQGKSAVGVWELELPDTGDIRNRFKNGDIEDILFVVTYRGRTPEWQP
jgi:hypothetical protein